MTWQLTKVAILVALVLFTGLFWWLPDALVEPAIRLTGAADRSPDYWIEDFSITAMNEKGTPRYTLQADRLVHYPGNEPIRVENPYLVQYDQGQSPVVTTADTGFVSRDGKDLVMTGNVKIARGMDPDFAGAQVVAKEVKVMLN